MEKATVLYYFRKEKIAEKRTSLIPREGETVVINGKAYTVEEIVWFEKSQVEIYVEVHAK